MSLSSFKIQNIKALGLAECTAVPKVMVIAGPNGVGKSTLLDQIRQQQGTVATPGTKFLYQPPHRAIRRTVVQRKWLFGAVTRTFTDLLSGNDVGGFEGLNIPFPSRTPDNTDEAGSTIKYSLGKIENRRQNTYAKLVDISRKNHTPLNTDQIPDVYEPLRLFTKYLLPHLEFDRVDFVDENSIKCIWKRKDGQGEITLDIDDLSSGEKSVVILFLPLLEAHITRLLEKLEGMLTVTEDNVLAPISDPDKVFVVDEPELHLHPDLQSKILTYLRSMSKESNIQFIVSTHSPTILDQALDDELYILGFKGNDISENQLKKVASNIERLEALKQLAGSAYLVTTGRSIVCIEGDADLLSKPADIRLFQILYPRSTAYTFIPVGGKGEVIKIVTKLREYLPEDSFGVKIYGLTDLDQSSSVTSGVYALPVCMIENLLVNNMAIINYLNSIGINRFSTEADVSAAFASIVDSIKNDEISYRIMREIKPYTVRVRGTSIEEIKSVYTSELEKVKGLIPNDANLETLISSVTNSVNALITNGEALKTFRGKALLKAFYLAYVQETNKSFTEFCYELAGFVALTGSVETILNPIFDQMINS